MVLEVLVKIEKEFGIFNKTGDIKVACHCFVT